LVVNNQDEGLNDLCLTKFVLSYDTNVNKRCTKSKIICWVSFDIEIQKLIIQNCWFYKSFPKLELNLQNNYDPWKDVYIEQKMIKNDIYI
jgi:hypothetical protein